MRKLKPKQCVVCGAEYLPTGSCSKYCPNCSEEANLKVRQKSVREWAIRTGRFNGKGKGGATGFGKDNQAYKNGTGVFARWRPIIKETRRYCEHCGKDLQESTHYQWVVHHKDHNKYNNPEDGSNWILLCKRCHQIEHKCWNAFEGSTTSLIRLPNGRFSNPNKRSSQEGSEMPDTQTVGCCG